MEEELTCIVCLDIYREPIILPCSHSLCRECAVTWFEASKNTPAANKAGPSNTKESGSLTCPACREKYYLDESGIDRFPRNLSLVNVISHFVMAGSQNDKPGDTGSSNNCQFCETTPPATASSFCEQCAIYYCKQCIALYHRVDGPLKRHRLTTPGQDILSRVCSEHNEEKLIYCQQCNDAICCLCVVGTHKGHELCEFADVIDKKKEALTTNESILNEKIGAARDHLASLNQYRRNIEGQLKMKQADLHSMADNLVTTIRSKEKDLSKKIKEIYDEKATKIGTQEDSYKKLQKHFKDVQKDLMSVKTTVDHLTFLREWKNTEKRFADVIAEDTSRSILQNLGQLGIQLPNLQKYIKGLKTDMCLKIDGGRTPPGKCLEKKKTVGAYSARPDQRHVRMRLLNTSVCEEAFGDGDPELDLTDNVCAGYENALPSACQGDSGGPLMCVDSAGYWTLVGVVNGERTFCHSAPTLFTSVTHYRSWIDDIIRENS